MICPYCKAWIEPIESNGRLACPYCHRYIWR